MLPICAHPGKKNLGNLSGITKEQCKLLTE
jgi:hypothetical protein